MNRNFQRMHDRQEVLQAAYRSIEQRMTPESVNVYVKLANQYAEKYRTVEIVQDWIMDGRTVFSFREKAIEWADSLP